MYSNNKVMSARRLCLPIPDVWTNFIQIFALQAAII